MFVDDTGWYRRSEALLLQSYNCGLKRTAEIDTLHENKTYLIATFLIYMIIYQKLTSDCISVAFSFINSYETFAHNWWRSVIFFLFVVEVKLVWLLTYFIDNILEDQKQKLIVRRFFKCVK